MRNSGQHAGLVSKTVRQGSAREYETRQTSAFDFFVLALAFRRAGWGFTVSGWRKRHTAGVIRNLAAIEHSFSVSNRAGRQDVARACSTALFDHSSQWCHKPVADRMRYGNGIEMASNHDQSCGPRSTQLKESAVVVSECSSRRHLGTDRAMTGARVAEFMAPSR
nr:hypothetical protein CFP56_03884 [Quercus suber]